MSQYQHVLVAIGLTKESRQVLQRALSLATESEANVKISLIHIVEPLGFSYGVDIPITMMDVQEELQLQAQKQLAQLAQEFKGVSDFTVTTGSAADEIHAFAKNHHCDLIVVGSHGRKGLSLLLGSTANAVLHGAQCDVLAVRVDES